MLKQRAMSLLLIGTALLIALAGVARASDAEVAFDNGRKLLAEAMIGDDAKLIPAAKFFIVAQQKFAEEGKEAKAQDAQACLYWCKKRMPMAEAEKFVANIPEQFRAIYDYKPEMTEAQTYFLRAKDYAMSSEDPLLVAIRWFEVADRFQGDEVSMIAQQRSLDAMQKVKMEKVVIDPTDAANLRPDGPGPDVDAAIKDAWDPYAAAVAKAKQSYVGELQKALEGEMKKGNLDGANALKAEIERMTGDVTTLGALENTQAQRAAKAFDRDMTKARDQYKKALDVAMKNATKAGDLEAANRIKTAIRMMHGAVPDEAAMFEDHYYMYYPEAINWDEAEKRCREVGGYLARIDSAKEGKFVGELANGKIAFIGLIKDSEGNWKWSNGDSIKYKNWGNGQPDSGNLPNHVGVVNWHGIGVWDDYLKNPDDYVKGFVCEWGE